MTDLRRPIARTPYAEREMLKFGGPMEADYPTETPILPPTGEFAVTFCVDMAMWVKLRSALMFGAIAQYDAEYYYLVEQLNIAEQSIGDCGGNRMYRMNGCNLQLSLDGGQTWTNVQPGPDGLCEPADGRTPVFRRSEPDPGCTRVEWKYSDEDEDAWRELLTVCDGLPARQIILDSDRVGDCTRIYWRYVNELTSQNRLIGQFCDGEDGKDARDIEMASKVDGDATKLYWWRKGDPLTSRRLLATITPPTPPDDPDGRTCAGVTNVMEWLREWSLNVLDYIDYEGLMEQVPGQNGTWAVVRRTDTSGAVLNYLRSKNFAPGLPPSAYRNSLDVNMGNNPNCTDPDLDPASPPYSEQQGWICEWLLTNNFDTFIDDYPYAGDLIAYGTEERQRASLTRWGWERTRDNIHCHLLAAGDTSILPLSYLAIEQIIRGSGYGLPQASLPALLWRLAGRETVNAVYQAGRCNIDCRCGCGGDVSITVEWLDPSDVPVQTSQSSRTRIPVTIRLKVNGILPPGVGFRTNGVLNNWHIDQVSGGPIQMGYWPNGPFVNTPFASDVEAPPYSGGWIDMEMFLEFPRQLSFGPSGEQIFRLSPMVFGQITGDVIGPIDKRFYEV